MGECLISRRGYGSSKDKLKTLHPISESGIPYGKVHIPEGVVSIDKNVFSGNTLVNEFVFPSSLRFFGKQCFSQCTSLIKFKIPDSIQILPQECFVGCTSLSNIILPQTENFRIGTSCFNGCINLNQIDGLDNLTNLIIEANAFSQCSALTNEIVTKLATIPTNLILNNSFANISNITEVTTNYLGTSYFYNCQLLKKIIVLKTLDNKTFGSNALQNCYNLQDVSLPNDAIAISDYMFQNCNQLETIIFPSSLEKINANAFYSCGKLNKVDLSNTKLKIIYENAFYRCTNLSEAIFSNYLENIKSNAFNSCTNLSILDFQNSKLTNIDNQAFINCSNLKVIYLGKDINFIANNAFQNCSNLLDIYIDKPRGSIIEPNNKWGAINATIHYQEGTIKFITSPEDATLYFNNMLAIGKEFSTDIIGENTWAAYHSEYLPQEGTFIIEPGEIKNLNIILNKGQEGDGYWLEIYADIKDNYIITIQYDNFKYEGNKIFVPINKEITYIIESNKYNTINKTITIETNTIIHETLTRKTISLITLEPNWEIDKYSINYYENLGNFIISDTAINNPTNVSSGNYYGYIKFISAATDNEKELKLIINCYTSSEHNYDFGGIWLGNKEFKPTRAQIQNKTNVDGGEWIYSSIDYNDNQKVQISIALEKKY